MKKLPPLLAFALVVTLGLAACGSGESDEDKITSAIEAALTKTDPKSCQELMTQAFLEQMFQIEGAQVVKICESNARAEESDNPPVEVTDVAAKESKATADVSFTGRGLSDRTVILALVEENGNWKLDEFVRFTKFDPEKVVRGMAEGLESGESPFEPRVANCIRETYGEMSRAELEDFLLNRSPRSEVDIIRNCSRR